MEIEVKEEVIDVGEVYYQNDNSFVHEDANPNDGNIHRDNILKRKRLCGAGHESGSVTPFEPGESPVRLKARRAFTIASTVQTDATPVGYSRFAEVKPKSEPLPLLNSVVLEQVKAMDLEKEELEADPWNSRGCLGQVCSVAEPCFSSNAAGANIPNTSVNFSGTLVDSTNIIQSVGNVAAADTNVLPSTSEVTRTSWPIARRACDESSEFDSDFDGELDEIAPECGVLSIRNIPDDEELDEPVRDIIDTVERAMDDEADALGVSSSFDWVASFDSFRGVPEMFTGPTPGPVKDYDTPYDAFLDIWDESIIAHIVSGTNRYAHQTIDRLTAEGKMQPNSRLRQWKDTDADEILVLFAIYIYMGMDARSSQDEYWKTDSCLEMPKFRKIMSFNRYILLSKFIHFADNLDINQRHLQYGEITLSPKLAQIAPLISHLDTKFSSLYNLKRDVTVDESMTLFKGRLSWSQRIRSKTAHLGMKSYELCESESGYLYRFQIYTGKNSDNVSSGDVAPSADLGVMSTKVVLNLLEGLEHRGHCITMDNFYNCPSLARYLKTKGFDCLGTLRVNRRHVPDDIAKVPNNVAKGTIIARHSGDVSIVSWKDSKVVTMISTYHNDGTCVASKAAKPFVKPISVRDYNNTMVGVDLKNKQLSMYLFELKKAVKWYIKMFKRLLNASVHNAFVMAKKSSERRNLPVLTHREFRYKLAEALVGQHHHDTPQLHEPLVTDLTRLRRDVLHCPKYMPGDKCRKRCVICQGQGKRKMVHTTCETCNVFVCFGSCWQIWHSEPKVAEINRGRPRTRNL